MRFGASPGDDRPYIDRGRFVRKTTADGKAVARQGGSPVRSSFRAEVKRVLTKVNDRANRVIGRPVKADAGDDSG
ncbi:5-oxoprolinase, ATP-hydrolyzing [Mycolicibacterium brisbanense]|uniref:5-oxoprolinase, ATP-hydrolyzing n=1 Tax=Mycolicibacterium brisbanense TaxID=146020 RepID=A0A100VXW3_9MYCO|nr:5-oxoprolinase, ATP-hydrolyzing [Mycolicibacterium brisbanense]